MLINRALIPSMILTVSLVAGGCNNKTKSQEAELSVPEIETVFTAAASNRDFERLLTVEKRKVKPADVKIALAKLGLGGAQDGPFKWADESSRDGDFTYNNLTATGKDGEDIKIGKLTLTGAHMNNDEPSFDRVNIEGLNILDKDAVISIERLSLARPTPALGASIMHAVEIVQSSGDFGKHPKLDDKDIGFGALLFENLSVKSDDADLTLSSAGWGEDEGTRKAIFLLEDLKVNGKPQDDGKPAVNFTLGSISASGIDMQRVAELKDDNSTGDVSLIAENFNFFSPLLDSFSLKDFNLSMDSLSLNAGSMDTIVDKTGDVSTIRQNMAPVTLKFSEKPSDKGLVQAWELLNMAGYDQVEISGSAVTTLNEANDSFSVSNGLFSLKDGFDLKFGYEGHGLKALTESMAADNSESAENQQAALDTMTFDGVDLSIKDRSIVDRAIKAGAQKQGLPEVFMRMLVKGTIMGGGAVAAQQAQSPAQEAAISDMVNALGAFIDNGGTLSIDMVPQSPVSLAEIKNTQPKSFDPERLGLTITHNE